MSLAIFAALFTATCVNAVNVPRTVSVPSHVTTTADNIQARQAAETPIPSPGAGALSDLLNSSIWTEIFASTTAFTTTLATTEVVDNLTNTTPSLITSPPTNATWTSWLITKESTYTSDTTKWKICDSSATCTFANATTDANGHVLFPVPVPILVIVQQIVPAQGPVDPDAPPEEIPTSKMVAPSETSAASSTTSSGSSATSSTTLSSSSFSSSSPSLSSSATTPFSSSTSSEMASSSSLSANTTSSAGPYCPTGATLSLDDDEGDNEGSPPDVGHSCPLVTLELNDENDIDLGYDPHDFEPLNNTIPTLLFKTSSSTSSSSRSLVAPTISHHTSSKSLVAPTLTAPTNRPNPSPTSSKSGPSKPEHTEYDCDNIRPYAGPNAKENCDNDEFCKSFEWWGPIGEDPFLKKPPNDVPENNTWDGFERTCEPYKENPSSYWCKSCTRNPSVCKIIRWYSKNWWDGSSLSPLESCWRDEICESDRTHTRICHEQSPGPWWSQYNDAAFCMECPRNSPVEPDVEGCYKQMDFTDDGRQDFPPYKGVNYHDCGKYCMSDEYAKRKCVGQQCMSCPY